MNRADTSNKLNELSIGLFYGEKYSSSYEQAFWTYIYPPAPAPAAVDYESTPSFYNIYGYSGFLVWLLYFPALFATLLGPLAPIIQTIPLVILMGYWLLQPQLFSLFFPDRVGWTEASFEATVM